MSQLSSLYNNVSVWNQPLQLGQQNLLQAIIDFFPENINTALDVGCGDGKITQRVYNKKGIQIVGLDNNLGALSRLSLPKIFSDADKIPFEDESFDLVLSTDTLEHISDEIHDQAWNELFRVAKSYVMVAVPFRETLLEATAICSACKKQYHVNWHNRNYDFIDVNAKAPTNWCAQTNIITGEPWSDLLPKEINFRRHNLGQWSGWNLSTCPYCNEMGHDNDQFLSISTSTASALGQQIYSSLLHKRIWRSHSEILTIFSKKTEHDNTKFLKYKPFVTIQDSNYIEPNKEDHHTNLISYPQVARAVKAVDGGNIIQFPLYGTPKAFHLHRMPGSTIKINATLEDGLGNLIADIILEEYQTELTINLKNILVPGYYGILLRTKDLHSIYSVQLDKGHLATWVSCPKNLDHTYYKFGDSKPEVYVHITHKIWLDDSLLLPPNNENTSKQILMLCHDQQLDRRIISQAKSLIELGHNVRLLTLAFDANTYEEISPEGIFITCIGLSHIIPENSTYLNYIYRQTQLNNLLNILSNQFSRISNILTRIFNLFGRIIHSKIFIKTMTNSMTYFFNKVIRLFHKTFHITSKVNYQIYKISLLLRYHNRFMHDPLPFRKAFVSQAEKYKSHIIQVHDLPALQAGAELAHAWQVPLVYDAHELYPEQRTFSKKQRNICSKLEKEQIQNAQLVFTVNESIAEEMSQRYNIAKPKVLLNAIDTHPDFDPNNHYNLLREKLSISDNRRILLFQGGFAPHRNLQALITAMKYIKTIDVDLVMMGFGNFGDTLKSYARRIDLLNKRIYFLPAVPQHELLQHSASADMGIIPYPHVDLNSYYCSPNKLFEFIQAGLPIIANDSPELHRFVLKPGFGLIHPMNTVKQISQAIDLAFNNNHLQMWKQNLKAKRERYSWENQKSIYLQAILPLINITEKESSYE